MFDLNAVQAALRDQGIDAWLLYDFRGLNPLATRVLRFPEGTMGSRRWFYLIPANGVPRKLVHRIEEGALDHLPSEATVYLREELEAGVRSLVEGLGQVAMEYSSQCQPLHLASGRGDGRACSPVVGRRSCRRAI
ncbi:MAG: hypothetical protein R3B90_16545 [Planctomycetaceae bacterium]